MFKVVTCVVEFGRLIMDIVVWVFEESLAFVLNSVLREVTLTTAFS